MNDSKRIHNAYHSKIKSQSKIISSKNFTYRNLIDVIIGYIKPEMKILDIGCGAGTLDFYLAGKVKNIQGIDISKKAVASCNATKRNLGIKNVNFSIRYFPEEIVNGKFDLIIFTEIIEHLEDDKLALKKMNKMLSKNGLLFLSTPSQHAPLHRLGLAKEFDKRVGHIRRYDKKELISLIKKSGFKIKEINETEGIIRNFLYVNQPAGKLVRFIKFFLSDIVTYVDNMTIPIFGASNYIIIAEKIKP